MEEIEGKEEEKHPSDNHIQRLSKDELEDALASVRHEILSRVSNLGKYWRGLLEMNKRKEELEARLEELGFHQD